ncbi:MAG TPA: phage tail tube protein [Acidisoma sp.]|nr:phage tail tube protein [Acidisoma sp.]
MSGTNLRLAGVAALTIDGAPWNVVGDLEYSPTVVTRETIKGQTQVEGYSEMPQQGSISANLRDQGGTTVNSLNLMTNVTVIAQLANGKTVYGDAMWQVGEIAVNSQEGTFKITFEGASVIESVA